MRISVTEAKGQLTELVRRAEAGDEVILTRHGHEAVRLVPVDGRAGPRRTGERCSNRFAPAARPRRRPGRMRREARTFSIGDDGLPG